MGVNTRDQEKLDVKLEWKSLIGRNPNMIGIFGDSLHEILKEVERYETGEVEETPESTTEQNWLENLKENFSPELGLRTLLLVSQVVVAAALVLAFLLSFIILFVTLDFEQFREIMVALLIILPLSGLSVLYLRAYSISFYRNRDNQLDLLSDILLPYDAADKEAFLGEIVETDPDDQIPNWKIYDPDWDLSWFFPEFTLVDFLTIILVFVSTITAEVLLLLPVLEGDTGRDQTFKNIALAILILYMIGLGIWVFIQNNSFEVSYVLDLTFNRTTYNTAVYTAIPFALIMGLGEVFYDGVFFTFFLFFLLFGIFPLVIEITLMKISVIYNYNKARVKIPKMLLKYERYWDSKVRFSLENDDQLELLRTLTAIYLNRYSIDNAKSQPVVPNSNFQLVGLAFAILIGMIGLIIGLLTNADFLRDQLT